MSICNLLFGFFPVWGAAVLYALMVSNENQYKTNMHIKMIPEEASGIVLLENIHLGQNRLFGADIAIVNSKL